MAYQDPSATHSITLSHWATAQKEDGTTEKSVFTFKKHKKSSDDAAIRDAAYKVITTIDPQKAREAQRRGEDYNPAVETETKKAIGLATFEYMALGWTGPEFLIPAEVQDPYAGQVPPCTADYIDLMLPVTDLEVIEKELNRVWAGRSPEEQKTFRAEPRSVADTGTDGVRSPETDETPAA